MYKNIFSIKKINNAIKTEILNATVKTNQGERKVNKQRSKLKHKY